MPPDDPSGARPAPVVLRIKLRYDDVETLAARFAPNIGKSGLFLPTKTLQAIGAEVKFELRLADDKVVITGLGKVRAAKAPDPDQPRAAFGMAIELTRVTRESRDVILKILAKRKELGLPEVAIPMPADIDAAKAIDTGVRDAMAAVPTAIPTMIDSAPILESAPVRRETLDSGPVRGEAPTTIDNAPVRHDATTIDSAPVRHDATTTDSGRIRRESNAPIDSGRIRRESSAPTDSGRIRRESSAPTDSGRIHRESSAPIDSGRIRRESSAPIDSDRIRRESSAPIDSGRIRRESSAPIDSGRMRRESSAPVDSGAVRDSQPILDSAPMPRESDSRVLTAPRRASGPIAIAKVHTVEALAPEPTRRKRPAVNELIERASGPVAAVSVNVPGLDDDVDVAAVMAMARALAGSDLDAELEALRDGAAAPIEISIEAASAELARQLGGAAVRRGWAPPPPVEDAKPAPVVEAESVEATPEPVAEAAPEPVAEAAPEPVAEAAPERVEAAAESVFEAPPEPEPEPAFEPAFTAASTEVESQVPIQQALDPVDPVDSDAPLDTPVTPQFALSDEDAVPGEDHEVDPEQIADEIHQLGEADFEEVEHTMIGGQPEPEPTPVYTEPSVAAAIEASLDQQLADADSEPDDLGFSQPFELVQAAAPASAPLDDDEEELEEIEDFEILAEADEGDADLLTSHGEAEASGSGQAYSVPEDAAQFANPTHAQYAADGQYAEGQYAEQYAQGQYAEGQDAEGQDAEGQYAEGQQQADPRYAQHADPQYAQQYAQQADPRYAQQADPRYAQDPRYTQQADPRYAQQADPRYAQQADPRYAQQADPRYAQQAEPQYAQPEPHTDPRARPSYDYSRHSDPDFHARLELSDEHLRAPESDDLEEAPVHLDPRELSAGNALAAFDEPEPHDEFALGGDIPSDDFDSPHSDFNKPSAYARAAPIVDFPPLSKFDESDVHALPEPRLLRQQPKPQPRKGDDGYDLETALEALDVDLDDLSIPHAKTERGPTIPPPSRTRTPTQRPPSQQRASTTGRVPTRVPKRATTDDGVLIDFDDDDE